MYPYRELLNDLKEKRKQYKEAILSGAPVDGVKEELMATLIRLREMESVLDKPYRYCLYGGYYPSYSLS